MTTEAATFHCVVCGQDKPNPAYGIPGYTGGTGYARRENGDKVCYACCANVDKAYMRQHGRITLYLVTKHDNSCQHGKACFSHRHWRVTNWPGTLEFSVDHMSTSQGWGFGRRYPRHDARFTFEGQSWYGMNQGDNQILRCRRTKGK